MKNSYLPTTAVLLVILTALLYGCASEKKRHSPAAKSPAAQREAELKKRWKGKEYEEIIDALGDPIHEMTIPRYGWPNSSTLFYGRDEESGCEDAFLVIKGDKRVWVEDYFCM